MTGRSMIGAALLAAAGCATTTGTPAAPLPPPRPVADTPLAHPSAPATQLSATDQERIVDGSIDRFAVPGGGPSRGRADAKVTIVVFNSFDGAWGRRVDLQLEQLSQEYPDDIRIFFRHYPNRGLTPSELSNPEVTAARARGTFWKTKQALFEQAALAAVAADAQGKFWEMREQLFTHQPAFERSLLDQYAAAAGLDVRRFDSDFGQPTGKAVVEADEELGDRLAVGTSPTLFINGRPVPGFESETIQSVVGDEIRRADELLSAGADRTALYTIFTARGYRSLAAIPKLGRPPSKEIYAVGTEQAPARGAAQPKVTVIAFLDFQCPYSARASQTLSDIAKEHADEVAIVFRHRPVALHRQALAAALAAEAAREQGKFWQMHDLLFARQEHLDAASLETYAKELGLDLAAFRRSLADSSGKRHVDADLQLADRFSVVGTPTFFVNGRSFRGSQPASVWRELIEEEIRNADGRLAAGTPRAALYQEMIRNGLGAPAPAVKARRSGGSGGVVKAQTR
jgi:protein-disulfide isomerase